MLRPTTTGRPHRHAALSGLLTAGVPAVVLTGCGGSSASSSASATSSAGSSSGPASTTTSNASTVNPNQRETLPPGDIPDTIAYVPFTARALGFTVSIPEGWSRAMTGRAVTFTDKLNRVRVFSALASLPAVSRRAGGAAGTARWLDHAG